VSLSYSYDLLLEQLGARIKQLRKAHGWTLRDMVVQHGFHLSHWQAFESGNRGISLPSLLRIAEVLGVTPSQLLKGLGEAKGWKPDSKK
jgi:transcriptional regulator with XRE-family HTH domain